jgi:hypothetical protein
VTVKVVSTFSFISYTFTAERRASAGGRESVPAKREAVCVAQERGQMAASFTSSLDEDYGGVAAGVKSGLKAFLRPRATRVRLRCQRLCCWRLRC